MPPTQNPKMGDYPNIERRFRIRAAKKNSLLQVSPWDGFGRLTYTRCCHASAPVPVSVANTE